ncbi:unnamed protein product [Vitrella brassicaformis CCMP3155]|uniref:Transmembrane protein n=1 Tax=Vitrella brassicaformis (strain CCMP3155) TaxID=1169540 RepID=A0A0G4FSU1_VITBC|nr:unnamed protein product [Vitrella brassicaformis CCMP3155]|eukprot:CEM17731.1 unnamed protein product [Vitrella brassicaformis CCMP3155]
MVPPAVFGQWRVKILVLTLVSVCLSTLAAAASLLFGQTVTPITSMLLKIIVWAAASLTSHALDTTVVQQLAVGACLALCRGAIITTSITGADAVSVLFCLVHTAAVIKEVATTIPTHWSSMYDIDDAPYAASLLGLGLFELVVASLRLFV